MPPLLALSSRSRFTFSNDSSRPGLGNLLDCTTLRLDSTNTGHTSVVSHECDGGVRTLRRNMVSGINFFHRTLSVLHSGPDENCPPTRMGRTPQHYATERDRAQKQKKQRKLREAIQDNKTITVLRREQMKRSDVVSATKERQTLEDYSRSVSTPLGFSLRTGDEVARRLRCKFCSFLIYCGNEPV